MAGEPPRYIAVCGFNFSLIKVQSTSETVKSDFIFAGLNLNRIIQKKKCQKKAHFMDDILKTRGITYLNV